MIFVVIKLAKEVTAALGYMVTVDQASFESQSDLRFNRFLSYWARLVVVRGAYPDRNSVDPIELGSDLLPNIFLVDILRNDSDQTRYRYRLLGEVIVAHKRTRRGSYLDEMASADTSEIEQHYQAAARGQISLRRSNLGWRDKDLEFQSYSVVVLPLADDGRMPTNLLGLCLYDHWY
jgi:hypothetical protein